MKKVISQQNTLGSHDSDHSHVDNRKKDCTKTTEQVSENSQKLLFEAFGSVNLGIHQETNGEISTVAEQVLEEGQLLDTSPNEIAQQKYMETIDMLENKLTIEENNCNDLKMAEKENTARLNALLEETHKFKDQIQTIQAQNVALIEEKEDLIKQIEALNQGYESNEVGLRSELEEKVIECINLRQDSDQKQTEIVNLCQKIDYLEQESRVYKQESYLEGEKVQGLHYELATLKSQLEREKKDASAAKELQLHMDELKEKLVSKKQQLKSADENKSKTELCISGLTQMTLEQKKTIEGLEKDIKKRDRVIERLKTEHEKLKAKVRKYRSLRQQQVGNQGTEQDNEEIENSFEGNPHPPSMSENDNVKGGALLEEKNQEKLMHSKESNLEKFPLSISNKENMLPSATNPLPDESLRQNEQSTKSSTDSSHVKYLQHKNNPFPVAYSEMTAEKLGRTDIEFHYLKEEVKLHQKEIDLLKGELKVCKRVFMKTGGSRAIEKVEKIYNDQITKVDHAHGKIVGMMRKRLEELADCLQKILGLHNGNVSANLLNASNLSTGDVSMLSDILNESRRLSKSFYTSQR